MYKNLDVNRIGIDFGLSKALYLAGSYGFEGIDVCMPEVKDLVNEYGLDHVKGIVSESSVGLSTWELPINWRTEGPWTDKSRLYEEEIKRLRTYVPIADAIGCETD